jgi:uncharacterized membrane protein
MNAALPLEDITHVIQASVAPVFLLLSVGTILSVLSIRLGRIVDRSRVLSERLEAASDDRERQILEELKTLVRRRKLVNVALTFGTVTALLVCVIIVLAFVGYLAQVAMSVVVAVLFIVAMTTFILALVFFLREVLLAASVVQLVGPRR